jgi:hypothetical protein
MKKSFIPTILFSVFLILICSACSSSPKRQMLINTVYNSCIDSIETANACILNGNYTQAEELLIKARTQAVSIDNYNLLLSVYLTHVSLYL